MTTENVTKLMKEYEPKYLLLPRERREEFGEAVCEIMDYDLVKLRDKKTLLHPDLALLLTTSGSTGSPKLVRQSQANINAKTASIVEYLGLTKD